VSTESAIGRRDWPWLASVLVIGCLAFAGFLLHTQGATSGEGGVPLDDAWIHFQFARNLAGGDGFSFNPGEPTAGSTAPLWTVLLSAVYLVGGRFPAAGQALSAVCFLLTIAGTYWLAKRIAGSSWPAWIAAAVVALNGRMVWAALSAQETCLFAALSLLAIGCQLSDQREGRYRLRTAVLFAAAALSRPEGYLLFVLSIVDFLVRRARRRQPADGRWPLAPALLFTALVLPYLAFSLTTGGHLLPNTYHAKASPTVVPHLDFLSAAATYLVLDNPLLVPFFVLGLVALLGKARLLALWAAALVLAYSFLHVDLYQHGRYLMPLIPCNAVVATVGLLEASALARRRGFRWQPPRTACVALLALVVGATAWRLPIMGRSYAWDVSSINEMHVTLGKWVEHNTDEGAVLALNDIGAITYFSQRYAIDLAGLITPEVQPLLRSPERADLLAAYLVEQDVDYVIIFPNWFPELAARRDLLQPVQQVTLAHQTITGGTTMVVYRASWH
jgi:arabinofuranosyltransferase